MPHMELTAIARKINDTEEAIKNIAQCSDVNMRAIMTSELERRLSNLQEQKEKMEQSFSKESVSLRIYGDNVESGRISSRILLAALGGFQSMLDSVANATLHSPTSRGKIPGHIKSITEFEVVGTFAGSFGLNLEQQIPDSGMTARDTNINKVMSEMFDVLETLDNSEQLLTTIAPCGKRTVEHYRQWLDDMRESKVNLEINWTDDAAYTRKLHMMKDRAPNIITVLDTIDNIDSSDIVLHGMLNGINIRNRTFEMSVDEFGIVKGKALPETLISVAEKIGTEISANMIESKTFTKAGVQSTSWYMVSAE